MQETIFYHSLNMLICDLSEVRVIQGNALSESSAGNVNFCGVPKIIILTFFFLFFYYILSADNVAVYLCSYLRIRRLCFLLP